MRSFLISLAALLLVSCSTSQVQKIDTDVFYKLDMVVSVDGVQREGVLVAARRPRYQFSVDARGDLDLFTMATCHRETQTENAGRSKGILDGLFGDRRHVDFTYTPVGDIESTGACPVRLGGYEAGKGRHSWAMIDFEDPAMKLPANVQCNGESFQSRGVTICQSKRGLYQRITFSVPVVVNPEPECPMPIPKDRKDFLFAIASKQCVYRFKEIGVEEREHRLTTIGYDEILVRKN